MTEPHELLGVAPDAPMREVLAARRRLARSAHPDAGGDTGRMQALNAAVEQMAARRPAATPQPFETATFALDHLPVDAYHLVGLAAAQLGDVWLVEEPYHLELLLADPPGVGVTIEVVPDAGGSTITVLADPDDLSAEVGGRLLFELGRI